MGYERYIGRVGALAIALGVGVAVGTTPGLGWAQTDTNSPSGASGDPPSNPPTGQADNAGVPARQAAEPPTDPPNYGQNDEDDLQESDLETDDASDLATNDASDLADVEPTEEPELVSSRVDDDSDDEDTETDDDAELDSGNSPVSNDTGGFGARSLPRVAPKPSTITADPDPKIADPSSAETLTLRAQAEAAPTPSPLSSALIGPPTTKSVAPQQDSAAPANALMSITRQLVATVLSPFIGSGPTTPTSSPLLWTVLAWTRRELGKVVGGFTPPTDSTFTGQTLKAAPPEPMMATLAAPNAAAAAAPSPGLLPTVGIVVSSTLKLVTGLLGGLLGANRAPTTNPMIGNPDTVSGVIVGDLRASDPNRDPLTFTISTPPTYGTINITSPTGGFTYTPNPRPNALSNPVVDNFAITVSDGRGGTTTATFNNVPSRPQNRAPINGQHIPGTTDPSGVVNGTVTAFDADGDTLQFTAVNTAKGTIQINNVNNTGVFTYDPTDVAQHAAAAGGAAAQDTFTVTVKDGRGGQLAVPVTVAIKPTNQNPINGTSHAEDPDTAGVVLGTVTATDLDNDPLIYHGNHTTADGSTVVVTTDGNIGRFTYTPSTAARQAAAATQGDDTYAFNVTVDDGHTGTLAVPVTVKVAPTAQPPVNQPPDDDATVEFGNVDHVDGTVDGTVTVEDPDDDELTYTLTDPPEHGSVDLDPDGSFTFTPDPDDRLGATLTPGPDTVTFGVTATDPSGASTEVPVTVPVDPATSLAIETNDRPQWIAFNEDGSLAYVANEDAGTVTIFDTRTFEAVGQPIDVGDAPVFVAVAPDGKIWVTNRDSDSVSVIDPNTNELVGDILVGNEPIGIAFGPNNVAYVANRATVSPGVSVGSGISVIDTTDYEVIHTIDTHSPVMVTVSPDGSELWVSNQYAGTVSVFDTTTYLPTTDPISMFGSNPYPTTIQFNEDGSRAYVTNQFDNVVKVIDTSDYTVEDTISVGPGRTPVGLVIDDEGKRAYVANFSGGGHDDINPGTVSVIDLDTNTVIAEIPVGRGPVGVTLNPAGDRLWVANSVGGITVIPISPNIAATPAGTIDVETYPMSVTFSPDGSRAYVTNLVSNNVSIIRTSDNSNIGTVPVGQSPWDAAVGPDGTKVYVANHDSGDVTVIDTANANSTTTIDVEGNPTGIVVNPDPQRHRAYVAAGTGAIQVIDTSNNTVLDPILFGGPNKLAVSPDGTRLYAAQQNFIVAFDISSDTIAIVDHVSIDSPNAHGVALNADGSRLYLTDVNSGRVTAIDTATMEVVGVTVMTVRAWDIAVGPGGQLFTANTVDNSVSVIDPLLNAVVDTFPVGQYAHDVAISPDGSCAYVVNALDGTLTVFELEPLQL